MLDKIRFGADLVKHKMLTICVLIYVEREGDRERERDFRTLNIKSLNTYTFKKFIELFTVWRTTFVIFISNEKGLVVDIIIPSLPTSGVWAATVIFRKL